jgi:hypothetical protein
VQTVQSINAGGDGWYTVYFEPGLKHHHGSRLVGIAFEAKDELDAWRQWLTWLKERTYEAEDS